MLSLASTADVLAALASARSVEFSAYLLHPGRVFAALDAAARRGARVVVRVEASPYRAGGLARLNALMVARLARDGADARVGDAVHTKALTADGVTYLDDCNWLDRGGDTILRDDLANDPAVATTKGDALALEMQLLARAKAGDAIDVETESFGNGPISGALERAARAGAIVRLLVNARDLAKNPREALAIAAMERAGVEVRSTDATEKFAIAGDDVWVGSANATYGALDQSDWGTLVQAPRGRCHDAFEARWNT